MSQPDTDRLAALLRSHHALIHVPTFDEPYALDRVRQAAIGQSRHLLVWSVSRGIRDGVLKDDATVPDTDHPAAAATHLLLHTPRGATVVFLDLIPHLKDERTLRAFRELHHVAAAHDLTLVLIDCCDDVPAAVSAVSTRFEPSLPGKAELEEIIRATVREQHARSSIDVRLRREDLTNIVQHLQGLSREQARQAIIDTTADDRLLDESDIKGIIAFKKNALRAAGVLEPVEAFATLDEIGGLNNLKKWLRLRERALGDDAIEFGIEPPRGVLMLGVQGAGKSLSAKAIATAWKRPLMRLDVGALYDKFIGETERRMRGALKQAEMMAPVVLWIDEIEKAFASAAAQSTDGGLSKRMFGSLLTWMQEHTRAVFLIATANDVSALPPELLRKGRFDEIFFIDLPDAAARKQIWSIHLKKRNRDPELIELDEVVTASDGYSGSEIEQAVKSAIYAAFSTNALLSTRMIADALKASPPLSVTMAERVGELRAWAKHRCTPAD
ncbi:MAG TPA: AAA family ATPase [Tepidisphaeraceae bacterium]|jgi:SpoVK/Ycf46/Vps4 family AAA+-type ATPase